MPKAPQPTPLEANAARFAQAVRSAARFQKRYRSLDFWAQFGYRVSPEAVLAALKAQGVIILPTSDVFGTEDTQAWITLRLEDAPSIERSKGSVSSSAVHIPLEGLGSMRALSVRQPWAEQILSGEKDVENRSYLTHHRGPLLIHASKTMDVRDVEAAGLRPEALATGALIGVVHVVDCTLEVRSGWHEDGDYGWYLESPARFLNPIPYKGAVGFMRVPLELVRAALEQVNS